MERVHAELSRQSALRFVVVDFARVHGLDALAAYSLGKLSRFCDAANVRLIFSGLPRNQETRYREFAGSRDRALFTDTLDEALQSLEAEFLLTRPDSAPDAASRLLDDLRSARGPSSPTSSGAAEPGGGVAGNVRAFIRYILRRAALCNPLAQPISTSITSGM